MEASENLKKQLQTRSLWQRGEAHIPPLPRCSLSSLWSAIDALFLLTASQNSERRERVLVSWKQRLKTEREFEFQSSARLHLTQPEKFVKPHSSTQPACHAGSYLPVCVCLFSHPRGLWVHHWSISLDDSSSLTLSSIKVIPADGREARATEGIRRMCRFISNAKRGQNAAGHHMFCALPLKTAVSGLVLDSIWLIHA